MAVLACFGEISLKGLPDQSRKKALRDGLLGGLLGYAWLLFYVHFDDRQIHHLLIANLMMLAGVLYGSRNEGRKKRQPRWREP